MEIQQIQTPALLVDLDVLEKNQSRMYAFVNQSSAALRPHYKSHKCTELAHMQLRAGAKGITCAKLSEAQHLAEAGIEDILIANQIVEPSKLAAVAALANCCRLSIAVDSSENVLALEAAAAVQNSTIHCLIEYEIGMGRCGVPTKEALLDVAETISRCPHLVFEGIQAYAGNLSHEPHTQIRAEQAAQIEARLKEAKEYLEQNGYPVKEISGCSTASVPDHAHKDTVYTEFQAGSYLFMDAAYRALPDLPYENALFVLTTVMSTANQKIITDAGLKSVSQDQTLPLFVGFEEIPVELSEEHCALPLTHLSAEESALSQGNTIPKVGEKMLLIPGHCCTTVNLYDSVYFVRQGKVVNKVPVISRGCSR